MNQRRFDYDLLRVFSMLGVIYLHTAADALHKLASMPIWELSNVLACLFAPAVPLFFMMSGSLLLGKEQTADLEHLFRRRLPKILIPYLAWTALTLLYWALTGQGQTALTSLSRLLNNGVAVPYWFLYALVPIYLLSPLLKRMTDHLEDIHWHYMISLWVILTLGLNTVRSFVPERWLLTFTEHWTLNINVVGGYLGYFLLGAYLERLRRLPSRRVLALCAAALWALSILGTRHDTFTQYAYSERFTDYLSLMTMALAVCLFLLAKSCLRERSCRGRLLPCLSALSFGVYLIHPLAIGMGKLIWSSLTGWPFPVTIPQQLLFYVLVSLFCVLACLVLASLKPFCFLFTGQPYAQACQRGNLFALFSGKKRVEP